ncbi:alpha/beta hydrolase [Microbacterium resistens]|uniref:alpha/beta hydrolase n=1 Tax=Microbacterium resistens TaxID=156977 RepID=UPI001C56E46A|nr:alpha/beta fold hydrolase [Microbacterium resistens]MBW1638711.1 alpha/beta hydrolase [Microbacterium resistens]
MDVRSLVRSLDRLSPVLAAAATYPGYISAGRRLPVRPRDRATHDDARRRVRDLGGHRVIVYEWGTGPRAVLIVHGWRGRASQFGAIIRELLFAGYRVVAFDAPASGDSPGRRTHVGEYRRIIDALAQEEDGGSFHAVVAHSAGALAALTAVADGGISRRMVAIAPVVRYSALSEAFARGAGLGEKARFRQEGWFTRRLRRDGVDAASYDLLARELPADLRIRIVHDAGDGWSEVGESRRLAERHPGRVNVTETTGLGHTRILEADVTLDTVLEAVGAVAVAPGETTRPGVPAASRAGSGRDAA